MATNTNGITTFWDFASWYIDNNLGYPGSETQIAYALIVIFTKLGREFPSNPTTDDMKLLGQECPTKDEIETWTESVVTARVYINNASSYASNQLIKYSDLRYEETVATLSINPTSLTLSALGIAAANNVTVTCTGSWTASTTTSWINLSKTSGVGNGTLTVSADRYTGASSRSGTVTFKSGSQTRTLNVTQQGATTAKHYLTVSYNGSPDGYITTVAYIDGVMRPSVDYMEQNPIQICEITADDEGKSYTVRISSTNPGETCIPSQFTGTLPAIISSDYNVGTFLIQHGIG